MTLLVQKYGGSSLTDLSKLEAIARKIKRYADAGYQLVVVLSAMQGETDRLIQHANYMNHEHQSREYDALLATGEQITTSMMAMALQHLGVNAKSLNAHQAGIHSDGKYSRSVIQHVDREAILGLVRQKVVPVITGFQGIGNQGSTTTLGRGGSDITAVAVAASIGADECQIFVDVNGVCTADPKIERNASIIHRIPAHIMLEAAAHGAKVIHKRAVVCAKRHAVTVRVCSTHQEGPGTMILNHHKQALIEATEVMAITHDYRQVVLTLAFGVTDTAKHNCSHTGHMPQVQDGQTEKTVEAPDVLARCIDDIQALLGALNQSGLEIMHEIKTSSSKQTNLILTMNESDHQLFKQVSANWFEQNGMNVAVTMLQNKARVSLIGHLLSRDLMVTSQVLAICQRANIKLWHLSASDHRISLTVDTAQVEWLVRACHDCFIISKSNTGSDEKISMTIV